MAAVETGHIRQHSIVVTEEATPQTVEFVTEGAFQAPDRSRYTITATASGITFQVESIIIGNEAWTKNILTGAWETDPLQADLFQHEELGNQAHLGDLDLDFESEEMESLTLVGEEDLGGELVYYLTGRIHPASLGKLLAGTAGLEAAEADFEVDIWIGVEDSLVRKVKFRAIPSSGADGPSLQIETTFSDYGRPVDIQAPEVEELNFTFWTGEDDHGDDQASATPISVGETANGTMDDILDYDYFVFQAEEGTEYRIVVDLGTMTDSAIGLYDSTESEEAWNDDYGDTLASQITWTAPDSGEYFIAVESFDVETGGTYTLTVTEVEASPEDDHGNDRASATRVSVGETVEGTIDNVLDYDYFVFQAEEGLKYRIGATLGTLPDYTVSIYAPGQSSFASQTVSGSGSLTATFWTARDTGECFLNVQSLSGNSGTYSLTITAVEASPEDDHGDDRASATRVSVGDNVEGAIEYTDDYDYFVFTAQEGQIYQIDVALGTLPDSRLTLYDSDGFTEAWNDDYDNTEASRIKWAAPSSDEYFLEVEGFFDDTGTYTLTVTVVDPATSSVPT